MGLDKIKITPISVVVTLLIFFLGWNWYNGWADKKKDLRARDTGFFNNAFFVEPVTPKEADDHTLQGYRQLLEKARADRRADAYECIAHWYLAQIDRFGTRDGIQIRISLAVKLRSEKRTVSVELWIRGQQLQHHQKVMEFVDMISPMHSGKNLNPNGSRVK